MTETLLELQNLKTYYKRRGGLPGRRAGVVRAVDGVSLSIRQGETFALVGESGCGKSTLGRSIVRLEEPTDGRVLFQGTDIRAQSGRALKDIRRDIQMIFQDPHSSLDPRMKVVDLVGEGLKVQGRVSRREREEKVAELLGIVGLRKEHLHRYPHEFSGGQRQRIGIARALMLRPKLVIADEAVSALDVSVRAQVLNLLADLQREFGLTYLFISHDLSVVEYISDRVAVMYLGRIVELATAAALYADPQMPYTQALLSADPESASRSPAGPRQRIVLTGDVPSPVSPPSGCPFRTRCWRARDRCASEVPQLREARPGHWAACHFPGKDETELHVRRAEPLALPAHPLGRPTRSTSPGRTRIGPSRVSPSMTHYATFRATAWRSIAVAPATRPTCQRVRTHVAMARGADQVLAKPGMGVDEGLMIAGNEMARVTARARSWATR
jgi:oligopeptide/dipeptide ABC transporter ATP-binding protein